MVWVTARACLQSVTLDEADSYLGYVAPTWPSHWYATSGNHVLNSILARLAVWLFGLSHVTLRAPSLLGAAIYITAALGFCLLLRDSLTLIWPLFVCLVYNPFVMDHLVAARGYSLALGFLMASISILSGEIVHENNDERRLLRACMVASASAAVSFCANFSFAYVNAVAILLFLAYAFRQNGRSRLQASARLCAACIVPGLLVTLFVCGSVVWEWPKGQLIVGATSLREMGRSVITSSFYELNHDLVNPLVYSWLNAIWPFLSPLLAGLCLAQIALIAWSKPPGRLKCVCFYLAGILVLSVLLHWLQFRLFRILLPKDRTGVFLAVLPLLVLGTLIALMPATRSGRILRVLGLTLLFICATYFIGCLRLLYFKDWRFDADAKGAFAAVQYAQRQYGIREFHSAWLYRSTLEFYRLYYRDTELAPFITLDPYPTDKRAYVLSEPDDRDFIRKQKLKIIYHGNMTDVVVAIRE